MKTYIRKIKDEVCNLNRNQLLQLDQAIRHWLKGLDDIIPKLIADMHTETKANQFDLVTNVDQMIQDQFDAFLKEHYPSHELFAEEKNNDLVDAKHGDVWIMDPIDGTANLVKQKTDYCIILSYFSEGQPMIAYIYDYPHHTLYKAIRDEGAFENEVRMPKVPSLDISEMILSYNPYVLNDHTQADLKAAAFSYRLIGACGLDSLRVMKGQFGAHINTNAKPWDISAQFLFAKELDLKMTNLDNEPIDFAVGGPFIISNKGCHEAVLEILNQKGGYQVNKITKT